jgi:hypothetical protein
MNQVKEHFYRYYPNNIGLDDSEIIQIEDQLNLKFPKDFKEICKFYTGEMLGGHSFLNFQTVGNYSIEEETLALREAIKLPHDFLVLYCEYGMIYMDCNQNSLKYGHVMYVGTEDAQWLCDGVEPKYYWDYPTFSDFFEHLLDEEEKERAENVE